jgi:hypothetical protein
MGACLSAVPLVSSLQCVRVHKEQVRMYRPIIITLIMGACGDEGGLGGRPGEFGRVEAAPECGALSQACIGQGLNAPLAKGSMLDVAVEYKVAGSSGPPTLLASANQAVITTPGPTQISAISAGMSAVMFVGPAGEVIDLIHVFVEKPTELRINRYDEAGDLLGRVQPSSQLIVGDEILVAVEPFANGQPLLGNFELSFSTTAAPMVTIVPDPVGGWYRVIARSAGMAKVSFAALGLDVSWQLEVLP